MHAIVSAIEVPVGHTALAIAEYIRDRERQDLLLLVGGIANPEARS